MNIIQSRVTISAVHHNISFLIPSLTSCPTASTSQHSFPRTHALAEPQRKPQRRKFTAASSSSSSTSSNQVYTARRTFPYPALDLYNIIADVSSYSSFLPYCTASAVTSWSSPDAHYGRQWPHVATLRVGYDPGILPGGFGGISESFSSRVFCAPPIAADNLIGVVEAVIGSAEPRLDVQRRQHHEGRDAAQRNSMLEENGPIDWLRQQWIVRPRPRVRETHEVPANADETEVGFLLEYKFKSTAYEMLSSAVAPRIAQVMIEVFERRARDLLGAAKT